MRRIVVRGAVTALMTGLLGGCAASGGEDQMVASPSPTVDASAEALPPSTPSPSPSPSASAEAPPDVDLTAEDGDYRRVVEEILKFREWLFAHPHRQDLVSTIYNEDCPCKSALEGRLDEYVNAGLTANVDFELLDYSELATENLTVRVRVTFHGSGDVVDSSGTVTDSGTSPAVTEEWLLLREPSGRYLVADQVEVSP